MIHHPLFIMLRHLVTVVCKPTYIHFTTKEEMSTLYISPRAIRYRHRRSMAQLTDKAFKSGSKTGNILFIVLTELAGIGPGGPG
jgi:hypothetical protein